VGEILEKDTQSQEKKKKKKERFNTSQKFITPKKKGEKLEGMGEGEGVVGVFITGETRLRGCTNNVVFGGKALVEKKRQNSVYAGGGFGNPETGKYRRPAQGGKRPLPILNNTGGRKYIV